jgi:membrane fusion protein, multidrug efflux system
VRVGVAITRTSVLSEAVAMNDTTLIERSSNAIEGKTRPKVSPWRLAIIAAAATGVVGVLAFASYWWTTGRFIESTDDAYVGGDITVIAPKVAGFISEVAVKDNQPVRAGDILIRLDDRDYRAALARAEAAVAGREAALVHLDAGRRLQQSVVVESRASIAAADAEIVRTRDDEIRFRHLSSHAAASIETYQRAEAEYREALAAGDKARAQLDASERQLGVIDAERRQAQVALGAAVADRETARLNLSYTVLSAPIDGTVGNRSARLGAYATIGAQLLSLVPAGGLWVGANFKENQLARMRRREAVRIVADVLPGTVGYRECG